MSDVRLYNTADGGDIEYVNGKATVGDGLETAAYLSLFGGNTEDAGVSGTSQKQWWGNLTEPDPDRHYRSQTQHLLASLPLTTGNLPLVEEAARRDLAWLETALGASIDARATIPGAGKIAIEINVELGENQYTIPIVESWGDNLGG